MSEKHVIDCDVQPFIPDNWTVVEHRKGGNFIWNAAKVRIHRPDQQKRSKKFLGEDLRIALQNQIVLNANVLDYLLAHPHLIPPKWKKIGVCFWGTIYRAPGGGKRVRCLCKDGRKWWSRQLTGGWNDAPGAAVSIR